MKFLILSLIFYSFNLSAIVPHQFNSGGVIEAQKINENFNNSNKADYDSGWIAVDTNTNNSKNLAHNLGVIPSRVTIMFSNQQSDSSTRIVRIAPLNSTNDDSHSPENVSLSKNYILIEFYSGDPLFYCDSNVNRCVTNDGTIEYMSPPPKSGYMKVLLWK